MLDRGYTSRFKFIDDFAGRLADDKDFAVDDKERQAIDLRVKMVCNAMLHDPDAWRRGLSGRRDGVSAGSLQGRELRQPRSPQGCVRPGGPLQPSARAGTARTLTRRTRAEAGPDVRSPADSRARFVTDHLLPLLDRYQWCVEELVLDVLASTHEAIGGSPRPMARPAQLRLLCLQQADRSSLRAVSHLTHVPLPTTLLSGCVMDRGVGRFTAAARRDLGHSHRRRRPSSSRARPEQGGNAPVPANVDLHARGGRLAARKF